jgi:NADPH:quinone reductase-like Zn-dependent oxidoreductase
MLDRPARAGREVARVQSLLPPPRPRLKAVSFYRHGGLEVLQHGDVEEPVLAPGEVLLRIEAAACNFNDIWARRGLPRVAIPLPHVSGTDGAGVIVDVADDVREWRIGDEVLTYPVNSCRRCDACLSGREVFCKRMRIWGFQTGPLDGSFAQYAKVQAAQCLAKPEFLSWTEAAATTTSLLSVWRMLVTRANVVAGESVLIFGASGGTGSFAVQLARVLGAVPIAVTSSAKKAEFCIELGAEHVIRCDTSDVLAEVRRLTGGQGVDLVFDHVGETTWSTGIECLRWGGRLVICGATEGYLPRIDLRYLWNKQLSLLGSHIGTRAEWVAAMKLVEQKKIRPFVSRVYPLCDLAEAQRSMESRDLVGKLAIAVG